MLRVAKRRLTNEKRKAVPKKPKAPEFWSYDLAYLLEFFWDWQRADFDPTFTPDGRPWQDQDREFWSIIYYLQDLWTWAYHRAQNPVMHIRMGDLSMKDL